MTARHESVDAHRAAARQSLAIFVLTVSDSRSPADDRSGDRIVSLLSEAGHQLAGRAIVPDEASRIAACVTETAKLESVDAIVVAGGTGVAPRDVTPEAVEPLFTKSLAGFGELFRSLSFAEIGAAAMLSRATAGLIGDKPVFVLPGSTAAVKLAMEKLILPEIGHLVSLAARR